jgi:hypothetical protein
MESEGRKEEGGGREKVGGGGERRGLGRRKRLWREEGLRLHYFGVVGAAA